MLPQTSRTPLALTLTLRMALRKPLYVPFLPELMGIPSKDLCVASSAKRQHTCGLVQSELGQESGEQAFIPIIASHSGILS